MRILSKVVILCIILFRFVFAGGNPPRNLETVSNLDREIWLTWEAPLPAEDPVTTDTVALVYDDSQGVGVDPGKYMMDKLSVKFTPEGACSLYKAKLLMGFDWTYLFRVKFYVWGDNGSGKPDLSNQLVDPVIMDDLTGVYIWVTLDFSDDPIYIADGEEFHVGYEKIDTLLSLHHCFVDAEASDPPRSFLGRSGRFNPISGDLFIRAFVLYDGTKSIKEVSPKKTWYPFPQYSDYIEPGPLPETVTKKALAMMSGAVMTDSVIYYRLYRNDSPAGTFKLLMPPPSGTTFTYRDTLDIRNDSTYYYYITAHYIEGGEGESSDTVSATPRGDDAVVTLDTLRHDSGVPEGAYKWREGARLANKFSVEAPAKIRKVMCYFTHKGTFSPDIFADSAGQPGQALLEYPLSDSIRHTDTWTKVDVSDYDVVVNDNFYVACRFHDSRTLLASEPLEGADCAWDFNPSDGIWKNTLDTVYYIRVILEHNTNEAYITLDKGWNLISLPVIPDNLAPASVFPFLPSDFIWGYDPNLEGYFHPDTFEVGRGYWVLSLRDTLVMLTGKPVNCYEMECQPYWNLIGSISAYDAPKLSDAKTYPSGAIGVPAAYHYSIDSGGWTTENKIMAGKGYFIYIGKNCILTVGRQ